MFVQFLELHIIATTIIDTIYEQNARPLGIDIYAFGYVRELIIHAS